MVETDSGRRPWIRARAVGLFLVAGAFMGIGVASLVAGGVGTGANGVADAVEPLGFAVGFLAVLSLYPVVAPREPTPARVAAIPIVIGFVGSIVLAMGGIAAALGAGSLPSSQLPGLAIMRLIGLAGVIAYASALFRGGAALLAGLLAAVPLVEVIGIAALSLGGPAVTVAIALGVETVALLGVGTLILSQGFPDASDAVAGNERAGPAPNDAE